MKIFSKLFFSFLLLALAFDTTHLLGDESVSKKATLDNLALWHPIHSDKGGRFLFSAFEESEFVREKLGRWLPNRLLPIAPDDELFWSLDSARIKGEEMHVSLNIWNKTRNLLDSFYWSFSIKKHQGEVRLVNLGDNTGFVIEFPKSGDSRQVCFLTAASVEEAKKKFPISKSSFMWDWLVFDWLRSAYFIRSTRNSRGCV